MSCKLNPDATPFVPRESITSSVPEVEEMPTDDMQFVMEDGRTGDTVPLEAAAKSALDALEASNDNNLATSSSEANKELSLEFSAAASPFMLLICPYAMPCPYGDSCWFQQHYQLCGMCKEYCLHPNDVEQRREHNRQCVEQHEKQMNIAFAIAHSKDKVCSICMENVVDKPCRERRFGLLSHCNHVFCLDCIKRWRVSKDFDQKIRRGCPECRVKSDFICACSYWTQTKEEKDALFAEYRAALRQKECKYFKIGHKSCPFGNKCFYKHALPDGTLIDVGPPKKRREFPIGFWN